MSGKSEGKSGGPPKSSRAKERRRLMPRKSIMSWQPGAEVKARLQQMGGFIWQAPEENESPPVSER